MHTLNSVVGTTVFWSIPANVFGEITGKAKLSLNSVFSLLKALATTKT